MSPLNACRLLTLHISVNNTLCNMKDMLLVMKPNVLVVNLDGSASSTQID